MALPGEAIHQASAAEPFLMNCWYVAAWDHELIDGRLLARTILDRPVVLYKGDSGLVAALDDRQWQSLAKLVGRDSMIGVARARGAERTYAVIGVPI